jgi:hypothetical protein
MILASPPDAAGAYTMPYVYNSPSTGSSAEGAECDAEYIETLLKVRSGLARMHLAEEHCIRYGQQPLDENVGIAFADDVEGEPTDPLHRFWLVLRRSLQVTLCALLESIHVFIRHLSHSVCKLMLCLGRPFHVLRRQVCFMRIRNVRARCTRAGFQYQGASKAETSEVDAY